jgi:thiol-disulfide isomerase/thioredoxin
MNRRGLVFGAVAAGAAIAGAAGWRWRQAAEPAKAAEAESPAPIWTMRFDRPEGGSLEMASLRGSPLLLNFWATWCPPCITELPLVDAFHQQHSARGWKVVALAVDGPTPVRDYLKQRPLRMPVGLAGLEGVELARSLGNASGALPFTVVFGRDGTVVERKLGILSETDLQRYAKLA